MERYFHYSTCYLENSRERCVRSSTPPEAVGHSEVELLSPGPTCEAGGHPSTVHGAVAQTGLVHHLVKREVLGVGCVSTTSSRTQSRVKELKEPYAWSVADTSGSLWPMPSLYSNVQLCSKIQLRFSSTSMLM